MAEPRPQQHPTRPAGLVALPFLVPRRRASPRRSPISFLRRRADHRCPCADRRCPCAPSDNDIDIDRHSHRHRPVTTSTPSDAHPTMPSQGSPKRSEQLPMTVTPIPEGVMIITMAVINIAELDIHVAELPIGNAELSISVSEFAPNYSTVAGDNAKGSTSPATTPTALLYLIIYTPFIKRVGWVVHCSLHGVIIGRESDTKSFVPFQGFALCVCVWLQIFPRAGSRISATTHRRACPVAG